ncbi:putative cytochrome c oxidase polypeptide 4 [Nostocoides japonicum T1-X7]|uniref:Cytochrome c oxidase polypeptide 4 n=1 Tax=Nostocoides japonicum T1-X7 TaxID=1194083 RepID=A0A077M1C8_9MICO|nr:cytochrome c oxidase subunit 4 [Tetrasphaera japonica]CCH80128.1 putative cytochrome c oxidase polypeptide 4 [Tetrasphaera japonica T1-X7]
MRIEFKMFALLSVFFFVMGTIYGLWGKWSEPAGAVALYLSGLLAAMIAYYTWFTGRKIGYRPEENESATIDEFEGDFGFFSPYSWWPLFLGGCAAVCFLGLAIGWWLFIIGGTFGIVALIGWTFEYWHGEHAQ